MIEIDYRSVQMTNLIVKAEAHRLIDSLPDDATWEELQYRIEVCQSIERGLADSRAERTVSHEAVCKLFGLEKS